MQNHPQTDGRPTMRDVARVAGVSLKTVSRVVNHEAGVRPEVAERVRQAIAFLGYVPDERARNLRQSTSRPSSIGFAVSDVANPFFSSVLRGLEAVARSHNCLVLSASSDNDPERQDQLIDIFIQRRVAGIVVVPSSQHIGKLIPSVLRETPVVFLDCELSEQNCDIVRTDHFGGMTALTEHLISQGHRDIAYLGDNPSLFSARLRLSGFHDTMSRYGFATKEDWILTGSSTPSHWQTRVAGLLGNPSGPTAIVSAQNFSTIGAVMALHQLKLQRRVALAGFDDIPMGDVVEPAITVYPQIPLDLGRRAGEILFRRIAGSQEPLLQDISTSQLILRGSGEIKPTH
jgi:LacI family transcriptional regulator